MRETERETGRDIKMEKTHTQSVCVCVCQCVFVCLFKKCEQSRILKIANKRRILKIANKSRLENGELKKGELNKKAT